MSTVRDLAGSVLVTDPKYNSPNRTAATVVAVQALTPQYPGENVVALDTGNTLTAWGPSVNQWQFKFRR
jgi:hypothetical protein